MTGKEQTECLQEQLDCTNENRKTLVVLTVILFIVAMVIGILSGIAFNNLPTYQDTLGLTAVVFLMIGTGIISFVSYLAFLIVLLVCVVRNNE